RRSTRQSLAQRRRCRAHVGTAVRDTRPRPGAVGSRSDRRAADRACARPRERHASRSFPPELALGRRAGERAGGAERRVQGPAGVMSIETLGLTAERCVELLDGGDVSCRELAEAYLDRIEAEDERLNCFLRTRREAALAEAEA